jgi:hypothetical protein
MRLPSDITRITKAIVALTVLMSLSLSTPTALADTPLTPFEATYDTRALGMSMSLSRKLELEGDTYTLSSFGKNMLLTLSERSSFTIEDGQVLGQQFTSESKALKTQRRAVNFDQPGGVIDSMKQGKWTQHEWQHGLLDRFSQQQQIRLTLLEADTPPEQLTFTVVDGPKISEKIWQRVAADPIDTPLGRLEVVSYREVHDNPKKRASRIWLAPELQYLMVKTEHIERSSKIRVNIESLDWLD